VVEVSVLAASVILSPACVPLIAAGRYGSLGGLGWRGDAAMATTRMIVYRE